MQLILQHQMSTSYSLPHTLTWSPDGRLLAAGGKDHVFLWNADDGELIKVFSIPEQVGSRLAFSPDGHRLALLLGSGAVGMLRIEDGLRTNVLSDQQFLECLVWSPFGDRVAAVAKDERIGIWESYAGPPVASFREKKPPTVLAWSSDSEFVAMAGAGSIAVWKASGPLYRRFSEGTRTVCALAWLPGRRSFAGAGEDGLIRTWDVETSRITSVLQDHASIVTALAFSADGTLLASKSTDGTVYCRNIATGEKTDGFSEQAELGAGTTIAFHPRELRVASLDSVSGSINLLRVENAVVSPTMPVVPPEARHVFLSYSHKNEAIFNDFREFLEPLEQQKLITCWADTMISPGDLWRKRITNALACTHIAVLFVSQPYLNSPFIQKNELPFLLEQAKLEKVKILLVFVSSSNYVRSALESFQALNKPGRPLDQLRPAVRKAEIQRIVEGIMQVFEGMTS